MVVIGTALKFSSPTVFQIRATELEGKRIWRNLTVVTPLFFLSKLVGLSSNTRVLT